MSDVHEREEKALGFERMSGLWASRFFQRFKFSLVSAMPASRFLKSAASCLTWFNAASTSCLLRNAVFSRRP